MPAQEKIIQTKTPKHSQAASQWGSNSHSSSWRKVTPKYVPTDIESNIHHATKPEISLRGAWDVHTACRAHQAYRDIVTHALFKLHKQRCLSCYNILLLSPNSPAAVPEVTSLFLLPGGSQLQTQPHFLLKGRNFIRDAAKHPHLTCEAGEFFQESSSLQWHLPPAQRWEKHRRAQREAILDSPSEEGTKILSVPATWLKFRCRISVSGRLLIGGNAEKCNASFLPCRCTKVSQVAVSLVHQRETRIRNETHLSYKISGYKESSWICIRQTCCNNSSSWELQSGEGQGLLGIRNSHGPLRKPKKEQRTNTSPWQARSHPAGYDGVWRLETQQDWLQQNMEENRYGRRKKVNLQKEEGFSFMFSLVIKAAPAVSCILGLNWKTQAGTLKNWSHLHIFFCTELQLT